jgi:hypothetical protein
VPGGERVGHRGTGGRGEHPDPVDAQLVEQRGEQVGLRLQGSAAVQRGAQVAGPGRAEDPVAVGAQPVGEQPALVGAAQPGVHGQHGRAGRADRAGQVVLDRAEPGLRGAQVEPDAGQQLAARVGVDAAVPHQQRRGGQHRQPDDHRQAGEEEPPHPEPHRAVPTGAGRRATVIDTTSAANAATAVTSRMSL